MLVDRIRRLTRWVHLQFGAAYFRVVAAGGSAAIVFLAIWPLSTVVLVVLVATLTPMVTKRGASLSAARNDRRRRQDPVPAGSVSPPRV